MFAICPEGYRWDRRKTGESTGGLRIARIGHSRGNAESRRSPFYRYLKDEIGFMRYCLPDTVEPYAGYELRIGG
jgi:hypothetical protein